MKKLFHEFYFYDYDSDQHPGMTCFTCDFRPLKRSNGLKLYAILNKLGYRLNEMTKPIIDQKDNSRVDAICV